METAADEVSSTGQVLLAANVKPLEIVALVPEPGVSYGKRRIANILHGDNGGTVGADGANVGVSEGKARRSMAIQLRYVLTHNIGNVTSSAASTPICVANMETADCDRTALCTPAEISFKMLWPPRLTT